MRTMQVERGKTRPQTLMTGHTGYITHARKIIMPSIQDKTATDEQELAIEENLVEEIEKS